MPDTVATIRARQVLDSRGNPTVECNVITKKGHVGTAIVPSGASTGVHEACELRDRRSAFGGKGVLKAVENINKAIARRLRGKDVTNQELIDTTMLRLDGTKNKRKLGANAILAVSLAASRAAAASKDLPLYAYIMTLTGQKPLLPIPFANVINGGRHAGNDLAIQEFMIAPVGAKTFSEAVQIIAELYHLLKRALHRRYGQSATNVGDEGGFAPPITSAEEALDILSSVLAQTKYEKKVCFAIDAAASEFYHNHSYRLTKDAYFTGTELAAYYERLATKYPLISLEDPFDQDDLKNFKAFTTLLAKHDLPLQVVGDDLTVTNPDRIAWAAKEGLCNALLLKVNQIGTLTEALSAAKLAREHGWNVMVSHRSGETEDPFIADLAVGLGCGQIKLGAPCRGERTAKYNQLLRIEEDLGRRARYAQGLLKHPSRRPPTPKKNRR